MTRNACGRRATISNMGTPVDVTTETQRQGGWVRGSRTAPRHLPRTARSNCSPAINTSALTAHAAWRLSQQELETVNSRGDSDGSSAKARFQGGGFCVVCVTDVTDRLPFLEATPPKQVMGVFCFFFFTERLFYVTGVLCSHSWF